MTEQTWDPKNPKEIKYHNSEETFTQEAGLFALSGLGMGYFYHPNGEIMWLNHYMAQKTAEALGIPFKSLDTFSKYLEEERRQGYRIRDCG